MEGTGTGGEVVYNNELDTLLPQSTWYRSEVKVMGNTFPSVGHLIQWCRFKDTLSMDAVKYVSRGALVVWSIQNVSMENPNWKLHGMDVAVYVTYLKLQQLSSVDRACILQYTVFSTDKIDLPSTQHGEVRQVEIPIFGLKDMGQVLTKAVWKFRYNVDISKEDETFQEYIRTPASVHPPRTAPRRSATSVVAADEHSRLAGSQYARGRDALQSHYPITVKSTSAVPDLLPSYQTTIGCSMATSRDYSDKLKAREKRQAYNADLVLKYGAMARAEKAKTSVSPAWHGSSSYPSQPELRSGYPLTTMPQLNKPPAAYRQHHMLEEPSSMEYAYPLEQQLPQHPSSLEPSSLEPSSLEPSSLEPSSLEPGPWFSSKGDPLYVESEMAPRTPARETAVSGVRLEASHRFGVDVVDPPKVQTSAEVSRSTPVVQFQNPLETVPSQIVQRTVTSVPEYITPLELPINKTFLMAHVFRHPSTVTVSDLTLLYPVQYLESLKILQ